MDASADLSKMKVADLKKELKARGLPVAGNKNELVERLQESILAGGEVLAGGAGGDEDEEEFDEEEILGDVDALDDEDTNLTEQEEEAALALLENEGQEEVKEAGEKKKISLKRSDPVLSSEPEPKEEAPAAESEETEAPTKVVKITAGDDVKTAAEVRAERFGTEMSDEARRAARAARFNITAPESNGDSKKADDSKPKKLSTETGGTDINKLKARAERFGEVTSKTLSKLEVLEKKKARTERFNDGTAAATTESTESNGTQPKSEEDEKKAARAAKFGLITAPSQDVEEAKKKRAERFAKITV